MKNYLTYCLSFFCLFVVDQTFAQLSPGELSKAHSHLEGLKNCTKCHILGEKETTSKCLECHTEIKQLIVSEKGFHSSSEAKEKKCAGCHGEHFGRNFEIVHFEEDEFKHELSGYILEGKHAQIKCVDCHNPELIQKNISKKKSNTFLGMGTKCLSCHTDFHQNTISSNCISCHNQITFRPATEFNHAESQFPLIGRHQSVECAACHKITQRNGKQFQEFTGIEFRNCTSCHKDVHENKFGRDCRKCHNEFSFSQVKNLTAFNHKDTDFPLLGKHESVNCKACHKSGLTKALKHNLCSDCHSDYHKNQFSKKGITPDCVTCHSVKGFTPSNYTIEKHKYTQFQLEGSHIATPCFDCHKVNNKWNFANLGTRCIDCHNNIHKNVITEKYIPENDCRNCHSTSVWSEIQFNHNKTNFKLIGKHQEINCRNCHFSEQNGTMAQQFSGLSASCEHCHTDVHFKQFEVNKSNHCERCHTSNNWKAEKFNHNSTRFKLDGEHVGLNCAQCHHPAELHNQNYIVYKFDDITCESCH